MISTWRRRWRRAACHTSKQRKEGENREIEVMIPSHFRCPISLDLMKDPVTMSTGITYDRESIEKWTEAGNVNCPITNQVLRSLEPVPNHTIRAMIQDWCVENRSYGIERIPTPRIPPSSVEILDIQSRIATACKRKDRVGCQSLVVKLNALAKESERIKRCIVANGTASVLPAAFDEFSKASLNENIAILEAILSCLTFMFPLDGEAKSYLGSVTSTDCIVWFLREGDFCCRRNAVLVLKEIVSMDQTKVDLLSEGAMEALFKLLKEPICPTATKASLVVIYHMVNSPSPTNSEIIARFVDMGLFPLLLEMLVDSERSICEKALGVLDGICGCDQGREAAYNHALTIPVLVRTIHRSSDLAMEFSVSFLWSLCKNEKREDGGVLVEALQRSAFQKLLLLLQVGCGDRTREKATELLKLLNVHRERLECVDSMDFKDLKRPF